MKFNSEKSAILKELLIAQEIIATKTSVSILSNVLLIAKDAKLTIKATDVKVNFEAVIPVDVEEEGKTTVFCSKLVSIINSLPDGEIEILEKNQKLHINSNFFLSASSTSISCLIIFTINSSLSFTQQKINSISRIDIY